MYERLGYASTGAVTETTYHHFDHAGVEQSATEQDEELAKRI